MYQVLIRQRLRSLRDQRNITQAELSKALGFKDRQILSNIEQGKRDVTPEDIVRAAHFFNISVDYFTDPLELAGEARFSWRKTADDDDGLAAFEAQAGRWIATFRHLSQLREEVVNSSLLRIDINKNSSFEEAAEQGDVVSQALELGNVPALSLPEMLEERLNTLVLFVDTKPGVSGAACQLGPLNTIIINRGESEGRRSFDLGHEFFHLLTWVEMPPRHLESKDEGTKLQRKIEKLADNFSAGLLMPRYSVQRLIEQKPIPSEETEIAHRIKELALNFRVSGQALKWRLVNLGVLKNSVALRIDDSEIRFNASEINTSPARFSRKFVETLGWGIEIGHLSARKAASVIGTTLDDLADLFAEHGLKTPFEL